MKIAILDYGLGNLRSVEQAFKHLGADVQLCEAPAQLAGAEAYVIPGVGGFGDGMKGLESRGLAGPAKDWARAGKPLLGICLGLQLLFESSEESPGVAGLGLLKGQVKLFKGTGFGPGGLKVPQMGWNSIQVRNAHPVFEGLPTGAHTYFVHSFYCAASNSSDTLLESEYGVKFCAAAGTGRVVGCQFHPEKSQETGLKILRNFLAWAKPGPA